MGRTYFVRDKLLPEQAPPPSRSGIIGWLRESYFADLVNSIATLVTLLLIAFVAIVIYSWADVPTWSAGSLPECRNILAEIGREGRFSGACWGVIRDRWIQLLFGFYPDHLYWRPILALILLIAALAPALFSRSVPRAFLILTAVFPFTMPWLLWGGSVWTPVTVLLGFAVAALIYRSSSRQVGSLWALLLATLAALVWWYLAGAWGIETLSAALPIGLEPVKSRMFGGFLLSFTIGVSAIGMSLPIGILLALGRQSDLFIVKILCVGFIEFIRGVPLITLLFVASTLLNIFMPPGTNFDIILRVIIMATLFSAAYMAEVIRGGLAALPRGQYEGADSLGLDYWRAQRLIIMPQALKVSIPGIVSTFIALFKDTTLVSVIGLFDPLGLSVAIRADTDWSGVVWELYGFIALLFFVVCFSMSRYSLHLERRLHTGH